MWDSGICHVFARCFGTFANYLGYLRAACHAIGCEAPAVGHPAIRRAMGAIVKREQFVPRAKMFIRRCPCIAPLYIARAYSVDAGDLSAIWLRRCNGIWRIIAMQCCGWSPIPFCCACLQRQAFGFASVQQSLYHLAYARHFPCASAHPIRQMPMVSRPSFGSTRTRYVCGCYDARIARMGAV